MSLRAHATWVTAACLFATLLYAHPASAESSALTSDWRQEAGSRGEAYRSPQHFAAELRFGGYYPQVDDEFGGTGPFHRAFGDSPKFYIGLEFDWQALRVPYIGALGPGLGWGYTYMSRTALVEGTNIESGETTSLSIMPWHLSAVLRLDELMRRTGFPVVPYAKFGVGFATWSAATSQGVSSYQGVEGRGTTWGTHLALGGMLALNWLDRPAAAAMDENSGVNHAYLFGEWMNARLDGLGSRPQMHVGTSSWVLGIAVDF